MATHRTTITKNNPRDLRLVTAGQGVSLIGDSITQLALPIMAVDILGADSFGTGALAQRQRSPIFSLACRRAFGSIGRRGVRSCLRPTRCAYFCCSPFRLHIS